MTRTFDRFLRSLSDADLKAFALERSQVLPPYWRAMQLALRVELYRRGLPVDDDWGVVLRSAAVGTAARRSVASHSASGRGGGVANGA